MTAQNVKVSFVLGRCEQALSSGWPKVQGKQLVGGQETWVLPIINTLQQASKSLPSEAPFPYQGYLFNDHMRPMLLTPLSG